MLAFDIQSLNVPPATLKLINQKRSLAKIIRLLAMSASVKVDDRTTGPLDGRNLGSADFNFISVLGKGHYAEVLLAETRISKELFAIKVFKKEMLVENHDVEGTKVERDILLKTTQAKHPFVVQFHAVFQTDDRLYFVLEYVSGGDLGFHIKRQPFSQERAR